MKASMTFISYHSRDRSLALRVASALRRQSLSYWLDVERLRPHEDFHRQIEAGLASSTHLIYIVPKTLVASYWVSFELGLAQKFCRQGTLTTAWVHRGAGAQLDGPPIPISSQPRWGTSPVAFSSASFRPSSAVGRA